MSKRKRLGKDVATGAAVGAAGGGAYEAGQWAREYMKGTPNQKAMIRAVKPLPALKAFGKRVGRRAKYLAPLGATAGAAKHFSRRKKVAQDLGMEDDWPITNPRSKYHVPPTQRKKAVMTKTADYALETADKVGRDFAHKVAAVSMISSSRPEAPGMPFNRAAKLFRKGTTTTSADVRADIKAGKAPITGRRRKRLQAVGGAGGGLVGGTTGNVIARGLKKNKKIQALATAGGALLGGGAGAFAKGRHFDSRAAKSRRRLSTAMTKSMDETRKRLVAKGHNPADMKVRFAIRHKTAELEKQAFAGLAGRVARAVKGAVKSAPKAKGVATAGASKGAGPYRTAAKAPKGAKKKPLMGWGTIGKGAVVATGGMGLYAGKKGIDTVSDLAKSHRTGGMYYHPVQGLGRPF